MKMVSKAVHIVIYIFAAQSISLSSVEEVQSNCCEGEEQQQEQTFEIKYYRSDYENSYIQDDDFEKEGNRPGSRYDIFMDGFMR